jgi:hypothetical protein
MHVVFRESHADLRRKEAREGIDRPVRDLVAILARLARGTAGTDTLTDQLRECADAFAVYANAHDGFLPEGREILEIVRSMARILPGAVYPLPTQIRPPSPLIAAEAATEAEKAAASHSNN